jgi:uncharacterized protein YdeI (YjbR/CyaY-like superfamily)
MTWPESVAEALCFGWIDGVRRRMDDHSYTIRFTPRKPANIWRAVNITKMRELIAAKRVHPAGMRAFERRDVKKTAGAKRVAELIACCEAGHAIPSLVLSRNPLKRRASLRSG